jgi:hypothetical protein
MTYKFKHKFGAIRCERDHIKFPSKLERSVYDVLIRRKDEGAVVLLLRQIGLDLPGGYKHVVDFLVFTEDDCLFVEAKGKDLAEGKRKRIQCEAIYGIVIHVVTKPEEIYRLF